MFSVFLLEFDCFVRKFFPSLCFIFHEFFRLLFSHVFYFLLHPVNISSWVLCRLCGRKQELMKHKIKRGFCFCRILTSAYIFSFFFFFFFFFFFSCCSSLMTSRRGSKAGFIERKYNKQASDSSWDILYEYTAFISLRPTFGFIHFTLDYLLHVTSTCSNIGRSEHKILRAL